MAAYPKGYTVILALQCNRPLHAFQVLQGVPIPGYFNWSGYSPSPKEAYNLAMQEVMEQLSAQVQDEGLGTCVTAEDLSFVCAFEGIVNLVEPEEVLS